MPQGDDGICFSEGLLWSKTWRGVLCRTANATHQGLQEICKACGLIKTAGSSAVHCGMLARDSILIPGTKASRGHALELGSGKLFLLLIVKGRSGELESLCKGRESKWFLGTKGHCALCARLKAWSAQLCRDLQYLGRRPAENHWLWAEGGRDTLFRQLCKFEVGSELKGEQFLFSSEESHCLTSPAVHTQLLG